MAISNSLPKKISLATKDNNGLMSSVDKIAVDKINRIEADVSEKMNKSDKIKSSQLDISNDAAKIQPENLSTAVKQMMTGQAPVSQDIKYKSIITDHYADNSVTFSKRTPLGSIALISSQDYCDFDTSRDDEVILTIPRNYTVYFGDKKKDVVDTPETLSLPKGEVSIITYSKLEGFGTYNSEAVKEHDFIVGAFDGINVSMFNGRYTVNGSVSIGSKSLDGDIIKDYTINSKKLSISHGHILAKESESPYINANFTSKFIEVVKPFELNVSDQHVVTIRTSHECIIPDTKDSEYLYIYYNLGDDKLYTKWINNDEISNNDKLVLIGVIYNKTEAVGINNKFISVNSNSIKNIDINYSNISSGSIVIDFKEKNITAKNVKGFINDRYIPLIESSSQIIKLTDDIITNITNSGIMYTLAAVRVDFSSNNYRLVFDKFDNIKNIGLDAIYLTSLKYYSLSNNDYFIKIIKADGNVVKSNNIISEGYTLPIDDETVVVKMSTELEDGNLILIATTVPGTSVVDPTLNTKFDIKTESRYELVVEELHGLYSVLFNTESSKIEIRPMKSEIDNKIYISLGFVNELSDSLAYTAIGNIKNHITLNANRPSNYSVDTGPDPDKGYDWSNNRLVLPKDIYLLTNSKYSLYCQNMSLNRYIDNDYINYEIATPTYSTITENMIELNSPLSGSFETRIVGKFKGNNNCIFKDVNLHFTEPKGKEVTVLCIGDDTVDLNMPGYISQYLTSLGYTPTMLGKTKNAINTNGYGLTSLKDSYGEGHKGWRMTDFMCKTKYKNGSPYYISNNPFMSNSKFDFSYYMKSNSYSKVDVVVISVGLNDITGYHTTSAIDDIEKLTIYQNIEQLPSLYKEMINSIHKFDSNIKIIINPTMTKGIDDDFNRKSLLLTETLIYDLKDIPNTFIVPGYLSQPLFTSANKASTSNYQTSSSINDTKLGAPISSSEINGMSQSILAYMIISTIISVIKD